MGRLKKVAVFGSRQGVDPLAVGNEIARLMSEHGEFIVVTTDAKGVCEAAKVAGFAASMPVIVFKPVRLQDYDDYPVYGVQELRKHRSNVSQVNHYEPTWADWQSACNYRSTLMVERGDFALAFQHNDSWGTQFEIDLCGMMGKPLRVIK